MKPNYHLVSFSGGKDSTAMLLRMIEIGMPIDEVVNCDTYMEFPEIYTHIEKIKKIVEENGIKFTTLRSPYSYKYWLLEYDVKRRDKTKSHLKGYSWAGSRSRWCTSVLKNNLIRKHKTQLAEKYNIIDYVGIAYDELYRLERENNKEHIHPLVDWGWSENDALNYCYSKGYDFGGLYQIFDRVSCWCCPLQSLEELYKLRKYFPNLWNELLEMDRQTWRKFRADYSVKELDMMFSLQDELTEKGCFEGRQKRPFRKAFKERINVEV